MNIHSAAAAAAVSYKSGNWDYIMGSPDRPSCASRYLVDDIASRAIPFGDNDHPTRRDGTIRNQPSRRSEISETKAEAKLDSREILIASCRQEPISNSPQSRLTSRVPLWELFSVTLILISAFCVALENSSYFSGDGAGEVIRRLIYGRPPPLLRRSAAVA